MENLAQIAQIVKGRDPQQMVLNMIKSNKNIDPRINQMIQFAQTGDTNSLVNLASSMFAQRGLDFN
jgi:hypothetical protein